MNEYGPDVSGGAAAGAGQSLPVGTRLQEFVTDRVLGAGGFGITYLAHDSTLNRKVVIKENLPALFAWRDPGTLTLAPRNGHGEDAENFSWALQNFSREAIMLASLDHPGIVRVLRSFEAYGTAYFVMPHVEGESLDVLLQKRNGHPFAEHELRDMLETILQALEYLHEKSVYHRDIKPGNILLTKAGMPVLIDFGSARQMLSERSMTIVESAGYTPFEQLQSNGNIGPWSDLYAVAATFIKLMTVETPPKAADRLPEDPWIPLSTRSELTDRFSHRFLSSLDRAFGNLPALRWQNSREWLDALQGLSPGMALEPHTVAHPQAGTRAPRFLFASPAPPPTHPPPLPPEPTSSHPSNAPHFPPPIPVGPSLGAGSIHAFHPAHQAPARPALSPEELHALHEERARKHRILMKKLRKTGSQVAVVFLVLAFCGGGMYLLLTRQSKVEIDHDRIAEASRSVEMEALSERNHNPRPTPSHETRTQQLNHEPKPVRKVEFDSSDVSSWVPAAEAGCMVASEAVGLAYLRGQDGFRHDPLRGIGYLRKAAPLQHPVAARVLAMELESGRVVDKDYDEAIRLYEAAALQGDNSARLNLGLMHAQGRGTPKNDMLAIYYYAQAARDGDRDAQFLLGMMHEFGLGATRCFDTAREWYEKSATQGDADARQRLTEMKNP